MRERARHELTHEDLGERLHRQSREGKWEAMAGSIDDAMLDRLRRCGEAFGAVGTRIALEFSRGAALRGVTVDIVLPGHNNLAVVKWASHKSYDRLLRRGCRIWHGPPPFNHAKLMVVDRLWVPLSHRLLARNWNLARSV